MHEDEDHVDQSCEQTKAVPVHQPFSYEGNGRHAHHPEHPPDDVVQPPTLLVTYLGEESVADSYSNWKESVS